MLVRSALALFLAASTAFATPPTDAQIDSLVKTYVENRAKITEVSTKIRSAQTAKVEEGAAKPDTKELSAQLKELNEANKKALDGVALDEATLPQIEKLVTGGITALPDVRKSIAKPLTELSKANSLDGARAAELRIQTFPSATSAKQEDRDAREVELAKVYAEALAHPSMAALLKSGKGDGLIRQLAAFKPETIKSTKMMSSFESLLGGEMSIAAANSLAGVVEKVRDATDSADRDRILDKIASAAESAAAKAPETTLPATLKRAKDTAKLARSGWARGTLIDSPAPEINFTWSNGEMKKLSDLKGKVVLVDFWATWCGPCVASFPKIRDLQARYKDYDVVILGVTSIQGYHIDQANNHTKIDCKDDPAKEMGLMPEFIKSMNMTWNVAFSDDSCFNPNYGVRGIPHLAIVDPAGKVRFNELRPKDPAEEAEKIDALLKEFKLKTPASPMPKATEKPATGS